MALSKSYETKSGIVGNYWKITKVHVDKQSGKMLVSLRLFLSQTASNQGKDDLGMGRTFEFLITNQEALGDLFALGYIKIKEAIARTSTTGIDGSTVPEYPLEPMLFGAVDA